MKKRIIALALMLSIFFTHGTIITFAENNSMLSEEDFLIKLEENKFYKEIESSIINKENSIINPTYDDDFNQTGYVAQFEIDLQTKDTYEDIRFEKNITSFISFIYVNETDIIEALLLDFRDIDTEEVVKLKNLNTNEVDNIPIENFPQIEKLANEIKESKVELINNLEKESNIEPNIEPYGCWTWSCTEWKSGGGYTDETCRTILGWGCIAAASIYNLHWFGVIVCDAGSIVLCQVPSYKICVDGVTLPFCE
jgi:hypothetical protein